MLTVTMCVYSARYTLPTFPKHRNTGDFLHPPSC